MTHVTAIVLSLLLAVAFAIAGGSKLAGTTQMRGEAERLGFDYQNYRWIGVAEIAATLGLVAGLAWQPLAIAAAIGLIALLIGAILTLRRAGDTIRGYIPAVWLGLVSTATAALLIID